MKITAFLLLILCAVFIPNADAQMTMIGVRGGVNLANEKYENFTDGESSSMRTLFLGGAQIDYQFNNSFALSLQILYDQKGAHAEMAGISPYPINTADWTINYLEIPVLVKFYFGNAAIRPYLFAGPSIGFLLRNTESLQSKKPFVLGTAIYNGFDSSAIITDSTTKFDFSLVAGAGISAKFDSGIELFLDAGYAFGLVNIDNYSAYKGKDYYIYSRDIRFAAGILFPLH